MEPLKLRNEDADLLFMRLLLLKAADAGIMMERWKNHKFERSRKLWQNSIVEADFQVMSKLFNKLLVLFRSSNIATLKILVRFVGQ